MEEMARRHQRKRQRIKGKKNKRGNRKIERKKRKEYR
jgi:hypothetical protein